MRFNLRGLLRLLAGVILAVSALSWLQQAASPRLASAQSLGPIGTDADQGRSGWYSDEAALSPSVVSSPTFGEQFATQLDGQIYAQPLVADGVLLVVTETNDAYGLNPTTGAVEWHDNFGTAWNPLTIDCGDLTPTIGITGTPVVDSDSGTAYFVTNIAQANGTASWWMQAVNVTNGEPVPGFPVAIQGSASNDPTTPFNPEQQMQRPGLAIANGSVFAAFGSHCDSGLWQGWVASVSEQGGGLTDLWTDETAGASGGGIWGGSSGPIVDSSGDLIFSTGNGNSPVPGPGLGVPQPTGPNNGLGDCVVKLSTTGGILSLADYFCPQNAPTLDQDDLDLASGGPTLLPSSFGTASDPNLIVEAGKEGEVYLLNDADLGGMAPPGGTDDVVDEVGPMGGVWSHPVVWPGDGGYIYIPTGSPGQNGQEGSGELDVYQRGLTDGNVTLNWVGDVPNFTFGSSSPIVTSNGTTDGSAIVWAIQVPVGGDIGAGANAQLDAFSAVPVPTTAGNPDTLQPLWSAPIGTSSKFNPPVAANGMVYVGSRNGVILAFGAGSSAPPLSGPGVIAPATSLGSTSTATATLTASGTVTVESVALENTTTGAPSAFSAGTSKPVLPATLQAGGDLTIPITFDPELLGVQSATLTVTTTAGTVSLGINGSGLAPSSPIDTSPTALDFGTVAIDGSPTTLPVSFTNETDVTQTVTGIATASGNSYPFSLLDVEQLPAEIGPGATQNLTVEFTPPSTSGNFTQIFNDDLVISTTGGDAEVPLVGGAAPAAQIAITTLSLPFKQVSLGQSELESFSVEDVGGLPLTITESKPPKSGGFSAATTLPVGTVIAPFTDVIESVRFTPTKAAAKTAKWVIEGNDGTGSRTVKISGTGVNWSNMPAPSAPGWDLNGSASMVGSTLQLTPNAPSDAGSAFWSTPLTARDVDVSFDAVVTGGNGGNGLTFTLANAADSTPTALGAPGSSLGYGGITGTAVALQTWATTTDNSYNSIGVVTGLDDEGNLVWQVSSDSIPSLRPGPNLVGVIVRKNALSVWVNGFEVCSTTVTLPPSFYVGFTGGTGQSTDIHSVSNVQISSS
ncbi:MAG: choice-of-anchor D domain-containing protein [Acidimicrobiales bacterium]